MLVVRPGVPIFGVVVLDRGQSQSRLSLRYDPIPNLDVGPVWTPNEKKVHPLTQRFGIDGLKDWQPEQLIDVEADPSFCVFGCAWLDLFPYSRKQLWISEQFNDCPAGSKHGAPSSDGRQVLLAYAGHTSLYCRGEKGTQKSLRPDQCKTLACNGLVVIPVHLAHHVIPLTEHETPPERVVDLLGRIIPIVFPGVEMPVLDRIYRPLPGRIGPRGEKPGDTLEVNLEVAIELPKVVHKARVELEKVLAAKGVESRNGVHVPEHGEHVVVELPFDAGPRESIMQVVQMFSQIVLQTLVEAQEAGAFEQPKQGPMDVVVDAVPGLNVAVRVRDGVAAGVVLVVELYSLGWQPEGIGDGILQKGHRGGQVRLLKHGLDVLGALNEVEVVLPELDQSRIRSSEGVLGVQDKVFGIRQIAERNAAHQREEIWKPWRGASGDVAGFSVIVAARQVLVASACVPIPERCAHDQSQGDELWRAQRYDVEKHCQVDRVTDSPTRRAVYDERGSKVFGISTAIERNVGRLPVERCRRDPTENRGIQGWCVGWLQAPTRLR